MNGKTPITLKDQIEGVMADTAGFSKKRVCCSPDQETALNLAKALNEAVRKTAKEFPQL